MNNMTYEQIEKEFDEQFGDFGHLNENFKGVPMPSEVKSFLKQSFIKYLQSEVSYLNTKKNIFKEGTETLANLGYSIALDEVSLRLQTQIKELEV